MIFYKNTYTLLSELNTIQLIVDDSCYDVVVLSEVLLKNSHFGVSKPVFYLAGCQLFWNSDFYGASRVISIYVGSYLSATIDTNLTCGGFHEYLWLHLNLMKGDSLLLGCVYRSPSSSASNSDNLIDLLRNVADDKTSHKVILGHVNWRRIQWNDGSGFLPATCSIDNQQQKHPRASFSIKKRLEAIR